MVLWLIRHAESTWNAEGRWQGQADPPLSERGREQARALARALAAERIDTLLASDLRRAAQTAQELGRAIGQAPILEAGLREIDAGSWSGSTRAEIDARDAAALARFDSGDPDAPAGGAETRRQAADRARRALRARLAGERPERLAVVTHGGLMRALGARLALRNAGWRAVASPEAESLLFGAGPADVGM